MNALSRLLRLLLCVLLFVMVMPGIAYAYWVASDARHSALARAATLPAGLTPKAVGAGAAGVRISITRLHSSNASGAVLLTSYRITRYSVGGSAAAATFVCIPIAPRSGCTEPEVPDGSWAYTDQPLLGNWAGRPSPRSAPVTIDAADPVLTIDIPSATHDRTPLISGIAGTAPDDLPKVTVRIFHGGTLLQTRTVTAVAGRWQFSTAELAPNESYTVQARQRDSSGNVSVISAGFVLDTIAPTISLNTVPTVVGAMPRLCGRAGTVQASLHSSADSAMINVLIYAGPTHAGPPVQVLHATRVGKSWAVTSPALAAGTYTAQASLSDGAGNVSYSVPRTFSVAVFPS
jgi:hypothetical protein